MRTRGVVASAVLIGVLEVVAIAVTLLSGGTIDMVLWVLGVSAIMVGAVAGGLLYARRTSIGSGWLKAAIFTNPILSLVFAGVGLIAYAAGLSGIGTISVYVLLGLQVAGLICAARYFHDRRGATDRT